MKRWKSFVTYRWRSKLFSLLLATILWFVLRQAVLESLVSSANEAPAATRTDP